MATLTAARRTYKDSGGTTDSYCVRYVLQDGTTYRFTDSSQDLTMTTRINPAGVSEVITQVTYSSVSGMRFSASGTTSNESGTLDIESILSGTGLTRAALISGIFDKARVFAFLTNHEIPVEDEEKIISGYCGETTLIDGRYVLKFTSLLDALTVTVGKKYTKLCPRTLGSPECGVMMTAALWQASSVVLTAVEGDARFNILRRPFVENGRWYLGIVGGTTGGVEPAWPTTIGATVVDGTVTWKCVAANSLNLTMSTYNNVTRTFTPTFSSMVIDHYRGGYLEFTSGNSDNIRKRITSNTGSSLVFDTPLTVLPTVGDTVTIKAGCAKRLLEDCVTRYNNHENHGGFPYLPGNINVGYVGGTK